MRGEWGDNQTDIPLFTECLNNSYVMIIGTKTRSLQLQLKWIWFGHCNGQIIGKRIPLDLGALWLQEMYIQLPFLPLVSQLTGQNKLRVVTLSDMGISLLSNNGGLFWAWKTTREDERNLWEIFTLCASEQPKTWYNPRAARGHDHACLRCLN